MNFLFADSPIPPPIEASPVDAIPGYEGAFIKMLLTLIALIAAIFLTVWALRRLAQGRLKASGAGRAIHVLEKRALSPKTALYLIEVSGKQVVIAESQLEIKRVVSLEAPNEGSATE